MHLNLTHHKQIDSVEALSSAQTSFHREYVQY